MTVHDFALRQGSPHSARRPLPRLPGCLLSEAFLALTDWTVRENEPAAILVKIRRVLVKRGYRPDKREKAVKTVSKQAELPAEERSEAA